MYQWFALDGILRAPLRSPLTVSPSIKQSFSLQDESSHLAFDVSEEIMHDNHEWKWDCTATAQLFRLANLPGTTRRP